MNGKAFQTKGLHAPTVMLPLKRTENKQPAARKILPQSIISLEILFILLLKIS